MRIVSRLWRQLRLVFRILSLARFSVILTLLVIALFFIDQGQEVILALGGDEPPIFGRLQQIAFVVSALICSFSIWYTARVMLKFRFPGNLAARPQVMPVFKDWMPRVLGALVPLAAAAACVTATNSAVDDSKLWLIAIFLVLTVVLFLYVVLVHAGWFDINRIEHGTLERFAQLPKSSRWVIYALLALNVLMMVLAIWFAGQAAPFFGSLSIVMLAAAVAAPLGSLFVYWGNHARVPVLVLLLLAAVVFSLSNDNHNVRINSKMASKQSVSDFRQAKQGPADGGAESLRRRTFGDYLNRWLNAQEPAADGATAVVLVSAEGGGIRAAYWTATVLGELERRMPGFSRRVFAISGVSGGSLGAAVYAALMHKGPNGDRTTAAECRPRDVRCRSQSILEEDFLSPVVTAMLFPDLLQRFLPLPVFNDRALALESAWERAWEKHENDDRFAEPFNALWAGRSGDFNAPLLFLNSTVVESGQRLIVQPLAFADQKAFQHVFSDALDAWPVTGGGAIPLSTATHLSARFTYVSPAGTIERQEPTLADARKRWIRVVDGGYFENSGTVTLSEILREVRAMARRPIEPVVIHISNAPLPAAPIPTGAAKAKLLGEVFSPLQALLQARPARGYQARAAIARRADVSPARDVDARTAKHFFHVYPEKCGVKLPLGWVLSSASTAEMNRQAPLGAIAAEDEKCGALRNAEQLQAIVDLLVN